MLHELVRAVLGTSKLIKCLENFDENAAVRAVGVTRLDERLGEGSIVIDESCEDLFIELKTSKWW